MEFRKQFWDDTNLMQHIEDDAFLEDCADKKLLELNQLHEDIMLGFAQIALDQFRHMLTKVPNLMQGSTGQSPFNEYSNLWNGSYDGIQLPNSCLETIKMSSGNESLIQKAQTHADKYGAILWPSCRNKDDVKLTLNLSKIDGDWIIKYNVDKFAFPKFQCPVEDYLIQHDKTVEFSSESEYNKITRAVDLMDFAEWNQAEIFKTPAIKALLSIHLLCALDSTDQFHIPDLSKEWKKAIKDALTDWKTKNEEDEKTKTEKASKKLKTGADTSCEMSVQSDVISVLEILDNISCRADYKTVLGKDIPIHQDDDEYELDDEYINIFLYICSLDVFKNPKNEGDPYILFRLSTTFFNDRDGVWQISTDGLKVLETPETYDEYLSYT